MKDALDITYEITKLIKFSPTRWIVKGESLTSIIANYETLQDTWEEALAITNNSEMKARIQGVSAQMCKFDYFYGCMLGEMILKHADNLSSTLQHKNLSAAEGQKIAMMTVQTMKPMRSDEMHDLFWEKVTQRASSLGINDPQLPCCRKRPRRYDDGISEGDFHITPKAYFRQSYMV